jgi:hypothetical protein
MATSRVGALGEGVAKGDLYVVDENLDLQRLPRGADNQFLTVDPGNPLGLNWRLLQPGDHTIKYNWFGINSGSETDDGAYSTVEVGQNASINMTFHFAEDFGTLELIEVWGIALTTVVDKSIHLFSNYAGVGENKFANAQSDLTQLFSFTADDIFQIDVTSLFTSPDAGDVAGIKLDHQGINTSIRYLGMHLHYKPT